MASYILDLNSDRCIYEEAGRRYVISTEVGHYYNGIPAKITVNNEEVTLTMSDSTISYHDARFAPIRVRSTPDYNYNTVILLSIESRFPHLVEQIKYNWPPFGVNTQIFPEE